MLTIAEKLSHEQNFVRVDLYQTDKGIYFGELTFFPEAGLGAFNPLSFDAQICKQWLQKPTSDKSLVALTLTSSLP